MIKKLLNKIIRNKTNLEITIEKYIELYKNYNSSISFIKLQTSTLYSEDKKENTLFLIYFLLNFSDSIKNSKIINDYQNIEIYEKALNFVNEQMKPYEYHNIGHIYDVIENLVILYIFDYFNNTTRDKIWRLDKNNIDLISNIFSTIFHDVFFSPTNSYMNEKISTIICEEFITKYNPSQFSKEFDYVTNEINSEIYFQENVIDCTRDDIMRTKVDYDDYIGISQPNDCSYMVHDADILSNFMSKELLLDNTFKIIKEFNLVPEYEITDNIIKEKALDFLKNKTLYGLKSQIGIDMFDNIRDNLIYELEKDLISE